ncbi:MAG TPA: hypothetical protein VFM00_08330 [Candidatus Eisenbacteria bacterium]|nr:hypothetical protein [Candidatus Eisenbacteria bacterium]
MSDGPASPWRARHHAALGLLALLALALLLPFRGYLTDDTFIHLQFAKHLIRGEGFAFNAGEPTYGATSPLWVLLLAGTGAFLHGAGATPASADSMPPLAAAAKVWGTLFTAASVLLMAAIARALRWEPRWALAASAMVALDAWSVRWAISGMETPLALALALLACLLLAHALLHGRSPAWAGLALGAAFLARPEFLLLFMLSLAAVAWAAEPRARVGRVAALAGGAALTAGPWLALAWMWFHRLLPNTGAAKAAAWLDPGRAASALRESIRALLAADLVPVAIAVLALAWLHPWSAMGKARGRRAWWGLVLAWPVLLVLAFAAEGVQVVSRYLVPAMPAVLLIGLAALRAASRVWAPRRRAAALAAALLLFAAQNLYVTLAVSAPHARRHTQGLRDSLASLGLWARAHTAPGTLFAVPDIGAFGYYSDRPVLDLYGLVTPGMARASVRDGYDAVVWNLLYEPVGRPAYLIDRSTREGRLAPPDDPATPYRFLFSRSIPDLGITRPTPYVYSVYAIDWTIYDRLHPRMAEE